MEKRSMLFAVLSLAFLFWPVGPAAAQTSEILTNAQGGVFSSDRRYWFAVPDGQRLRLTVNGNETYRGPGPASCSFSLRPGEDRSFELSVERRSPPPSDEVLESLAYLVRMDSVPPAQVVVSGRQENGASSPWTLSFTAEEGSRIYALVDADSYLSSFSDVTEPLSFSSRRVEGLAWCVDAAGNPSIPAPFSFKPFSLTVANPVPGTWANRQRLVVSSEGAADVFWSVDGSDPFGPTGEPYRGPTLIDRTGAVVLRVAAKSPDGRVEHQRVEFEAKGVESPALSGLRDIESTPVLANRTAAVPSGFRWDIGAEAENASPSSLAFVGGSAPVLRPIEGIGRLVPFYAGDGTELHRFLFALGSDKTASGPASPVPSAAADGPVPRVFSSGRARAVFWDHGNGQVRFRWNGTVLWVDAVAPIAVAAEGGTLEWIVEKGSTVEGPFSMVFPAMAAEASFPSSIPQASAPHASVSGGAVDLRPPESAEGVRFTLAAATAGLEPRTVELPRGSSVRLDVCDGEQFSWTAYGEGASLILRIDRRPPAPPRVDAPAEGSWVHDAPTVTFDAEEGQVDAYARWQDEDGRSDSYPLPISSELRGNGRGVVDYEIKAQTVDVAGNASAPVIRKFTVDETTVYVSGGNSHSIGDGSRAKPFDDLNDALALAAAKGRSRVWISGTAAVREDIQLIDGLSVEGGFDAGWKRTGGTSDLILPSGISLIAPRGSSSVSSLRLVEESERRRPLISVAGASLELSRITVVPYDADRAVAPVLYLRSGGGVSARDCLFPGGSPSIDSVSSDLVLTECLVTATGGRDGRQASIRAENSNLRLQSSRVEAGSTIGVVLPRYATAVDARGGSLSLKRSVVSAAASSSASSLIVRDLSLETENTEVSAIADDYAAALSTEDCAVSVSGGSLSAQGRDAASLLLSNSRGSRFDSVGFSVSGNGVVRAVQVRGPFPTISSCRFAAEGGNEGAEALAGDPPTDGSVWGNRFSGFAYLYDRSFPVESMQAFNRSFAGNGQPNYSVSDGK